MRVLFCGDRNWRLRKPIAQELLKLNEKTTIIVHGAARGADSMAAMIAQDMGFKTEAHPAQWELYGRAAGPIRNQEMLDSGIDLVLAFHENLARSKGTKDMVKRAKKAGVEVMVIS